MLTMSFKRKNKILICNKPVFLYTIGAAMKSMHLKTLSCLMDNYEKLFVYMDLLLHVMDGPTSQTHVTSAPQDSVEAFMKL